MGQFPDEPSTFPLVVAGDSVGTLRVAPRVAGSSYSAADGRVLGALAPQVAVVVHALDLAGALEVQRDRVVAATRSERDRLRQELHDGLGPTLAGTALGLQAARDALAAEDAETLGRLLDRIGSEVDLAVADVRRVIDDLRPAELDEGSLDLAVRRRAASVASVVDVDVDVGAIPELRPEVEIAAYRIASEALNNVARHAGAQHVRLAVSVGDGSLTLRVADDGSGIPESAPAGVGLESMRRRAAGGRRRLRRRLRPGRHRGHRKASPMTAETAGLGTAGAAPRIRVVVADDHPMFRFGLLAALAGAARGRGRRRGCGRH